jgi:hypothetical protein
VAGRREGGRAVGYPGTECYINVYSLFSAESRNVASSWDLGRRVGVVGFTTRTYILQLPFGVALV